MLPKMYCLDIRENPWRTEAVQQRFKDAGLQVEHFYGLHGNTIGVVPIHTVWDSKRDNTYRNTPGKLAITFSKMMLWQHILDAGVEECIIFENDVTFCPSFVEEFTTSYRALPEDWQAAHIGYCCGDDKPTDVINERISKIRYPMCCHAILWKREALAKAFEAFRVADWGTNSDIILQKVVYPKLNHYCFTPQLAFQEVADSEAALNVGFQNIHGWFNFSRIYDEQLDRVGEKESTFVEVGSWLGASSAYMAEEIKRRLKNVDFFAVDTWQGTPGEAHMTPIIKHLGGTAFQAWQVNMIRAGVSHYVTPICKPSVEAAKEFPDKSIDFVFIDAAHDFDNVVADIRAWLPKVKKGGCLAGHDYDWDGVKKAVNQELAGQFRTWETVWIIDNVRHR